MRVPEDIQRRVSGTAVSAFETRAKTDEVVGLGMRGGARRCLPDPPSWPKSASLP